MVGLPHVGDILSQSCQDCQIVPCCCNLAALVAGHVEIACHTISPSICLLFQVAGALSCPNVMPGDIAPLGDPGNAGGSRGSLSSTSNLSAADPLPQSSVGSFISPDRALSPCWCLSQ